MIDGSKGGNGSQYVNHSSNANIIFHEVDGKIFLMAQRDIVPGEDLLVNYGINYDELFFEQKIQYTYFNPQDCQPDDIHKNASVGGVNQYWIESSSNIRSNILAFLAPKGTKADLYIPLASQSLIGKSLKPYTYDGRHNDPLANHLLSNTQAQLRTLELPVLLNLENDGEFLPIAQQYFTTPLMVACILGKDRDAEALLTHTPTRTILALQGVTGNDALMLTLLGLGNKLQKTKTITLNIGVTFLF